MGEEWISGIRGLYGDGPVSNTGRRLRLDSGRTPIPGLRDLVPQRPDAHWVANASWPRNTTKDSFPI